MRVEEKKFSGVLNSLKSSLSYRSRIYQQVTVVDNNFLLLQISVQRFGARVSICEDLPRVLRCAGMLVVTRQVPHQVVTAARGVRAAERTRRAAPPLAGAGPAQRAAAARRRLPRPPRARHRPRRLRLTHIIPIAHSNRRISTIQPQTIIKLVILWH